MFKPSPTLSARLRLTTKQVNGGYYKGNRTGSMGSHTEFGGYVIDYRKTRHYNMPDLQNFHLTPFVTKEMEPTKREQTRPDGTTYEPPKIDGMEFLKSWKYSAPAQYEEVLRHQARVAETPVEPKPEPIQEKAATAVTPSRPAITTSPGTRAYSTTARRLATPKTYAINKNQIDPDLRGNRLGILIPKAERRAKQAEIMSARLEERRAQKEAEKLKRREHYEQTMAREKAKWNALSDEERERSIEAAKQRKADRNAAAARGEKYVALWGK